MVPYSKTVSLKKKSAIKMIREARKAGWKVEIETDPMRRVGESNFYVGGWRTFSLYKSFIRFGITVVSGHILITFKTSRTSAGNVRVSASVRSKADFHPGYKMNPGEFAAMQVFNYVEKEEKQENERKEVIE
jgi:hypothetical protein